MGEADDRVHRRTDLVAHVGEELGFVFAASSAATFASDRAVWTLVSSVTSTIQPSKPCCPSYSMCMRVERQSWDLAIRAAELNSKIVDDALAAKFIEQGSALFWTNIDVRDGRPHLDRKHFLSTRIGESSDVVVGRYRDPHWRGIEYFLQPFPLAAEGVGRLPEQRKRCLIDFPRDLLILP